MSVPQRRTKARSTACGSFAMTLSSTLAADRLDVDLGRNVQAHPGDRFPFPWRTACSRPRLMLAKALLMRRPSSFL
jgi:hypothetical protein